MDYNELKLIKMFLTDFSIKVKGLALAKQRQLEEYKATYAQQVVMMMLMMMMMIMMMLVSMVSIYWHAY